MASKKTIAQLVVQLTVEATKAKRNLSKIRREAKKTADELDKVGDSAKKAGDGTASAGKQSGKAAKRLELLKKAGAAVGQALLEAAKIAGTSFVTAVAGLGVSVIKTSNEFDLLDKQLTNAMGSSALAEKAMDSLKKQAADTPHSVQQLTNSFLKLENRGLRNGEEALRSYGDVAATMGKDLDQMVEAALDATTGEFERLKEFGITAAKEGDKVSFMFKGQRTEVDNTQSAIEQYLISLGKIDGVSGAMSIQMSTVSGLFSNLKDAAANFLNEIGELGVLDEFKLLLTDVKNLLGGGDQESLASILAEGLIDLIKSFRDAVSDVSQEDIQGWIQDFSDKMRDLADMIDIAWDALKWIIDNKEEMKTAIETVTLAVIALKVAFVGPAGLVVAAAAAGVAIGNFMNKFGASDKLADWLADLTGLNNELERLGKITDVRGGAKFLGGGGPIDTSDLGEETVVIEREDSTLATANKEGLYALAQSDDPIMRKQATEKLEEMLSDDIAENQAAAQRRAQKNLAEVADDNKKKPPRRKRKKEPTSGVELGESLMALREGSRDPAKLAKIAQELSAKTPKAKDIKPTVAISFFNFNMKNNFKGGDPKKIAEEIKDKIVERFKKANSKAGEAFSSNIII